MSKTLSFCQCKVLVVDKMGTISSFVCCRPAKGKLENGLMACKRHINLSKEPSKK